jgi:transposase
LLFRAGSCRASLRNARKGISIAVTPADRVRLEAIVRDRNSPQKHVWRAQIVLLTAGGQGTNAITSAVGKDKTVVWRWQERFMHEGVAGLTRDKTRPSRVPPLPTATVDRVVALTNQAPPHAATHWTASAMAKTVGISPSSVRRIWAGQGLQPHRVRAFKISNDPKFADKLKDVVGLYVDPPAHAVVLSIDEKSQIQALDRTQPGLPMKKGRCATMTHDYKRNGTTTLFAALDILEGKVIGRCMQRHRHQEFIRFLNAVEREVPAGKAVHVVLDNYATHKHPKVTTWLKRHQRFTFHFTPTSCSWANAVEGLFAKLTRQRLKRGVFTSILDLQAAINRFIAETNDKPKPFVWIKSADAILAAVQRGRQAFRRTPLARRRAHPNTGNTYKIGIATVNVLVKDPPGEPSLLPSNARLSTSRIRVGSSPITWSV